MTATESFAVADDGVRLWTSTTGTGPAFAIAHGGPGHWSQLEPVAAMVDDLVAVRFWDQRGAGRSDPVGPYSYERVIADVEVVRRHFGDERWILGGHSWGCTVALHYAFAHRDRVRALVLLSGTGIEWTRRRQQNREEEERRLTGAEHARRVALGDRPVHTAEEAAEADYLRLVADLGERDEERRRDRARTLVDTRFPVGREANAALNAETKTLDPAEVAARCAQLDVPVLVVHGARDPRPVDALATMVEALPDVRVEILPDVGHLPWAEHPDRLRAVLRNFLSVRCSG